MKQFKLFICFLLSIGVMVLLHLLLKTLKVDSMSRSIIFACTGITLIGTFIILSNKKSKQHSQIYYNYSAALSQIIFILLPFLISIIVNLYKAGIAEEEIWYLAYAPEWSLCSMLLFGQSVVKLMNDKSWDKGPIASVFMVFGIVPSAIIYGLSLTNGPSLPPWVYYTQMIMLSSGILSLLHFGKTAVHDSNRND